MLRQLSSGPEGKSNICEPNLLYFLCASSEDPGKKAQVHIPKSHVHCVCGFCAVSLS